MPWLQRHHLLPRQLLSLGSLARFLDRIGNERLGLEDFRPNGLLLPATEAAALETGMPLHRGPHRHYNAVVIERVGQIEQEWPHRAASDPERALEEALFRLTLLQSALRRRLLDERRRIVLNRKDPLGSGFDFTELDAMAEQLWQAS